MKSLGLSSSSDEIMSILRMNYFQVVEDHGTPLRDVLADGRSRVRSLVERRARQYGLSVVGI